MLKNNYLIKIIFIIILITMLILITGCSNNEGGLPQVSNYNVNYTVLDESDVPIEGAIVTLDGASKTTDSNGVVTFSASNRTYNYLVTADGYDDKTDTVIVDGNDTKVNITLVAQNPAVEEYTITFTVTDNNNNTVEGAEVSLDGDFESTDSNGQVIFLKENGTYSYSVSKTGYVGVNDNDEINGNVVVNDSDVPLNITLNLAPPEGFIGIYSWADLDAVRDDLTADYILMNDLDSTTSDYDILASGSANEGKGWAPIGIPVDAFNLEGSFTGEFDGNNKTIADFEINRPDSEEKYTGLFGYIHEGTVKNLKLINFNIIGYSRVGSIAGISDNSSIINSNLSGGSIVGVTCVGGLVGQNFDQTTISNSYATISVSGNTEYSNNRIGGLVGFNEDSFIEKSYSTGNVSSDSECGGLVGKNTNGNIESCYYDSDTSGQSDTGKGSPRTTKQLQEGTADTTIDGDPMYTSWETTIWDFGSDTDYPSLSWE